MCECFRSQAPQNAELVEPAGALAAIEALYSFMWCENQGGGSSSSAKVVRRAQQSCVPKTFEGDPDYRKTYLVIQVGTCLCCLVGFLFFVFSSKSIICIFYAWYEKL